MTILAASTDADGPVPFLALQHHSQSRFNRLTHSFGYHTTPRLRPDARSLPSPRKDAVTAPSEALLRPRLAFLPEVFLVFLRLGLMSFGGPIAHIGYFRAEIVERRKWIHPETFADLLALCQFLPGPASSELGVALGM